MQHRTTPVPARLVDALCLVAVVLLSALPYIGALGFYSDDWALLTEFQSLAAQGGSPVAQATAEHFSNRPAQGVYLTILFNLFGFDALGSHIVNHSVIAASAVLFYLLLLRIGAGRAHAFAIVLLFTLLPQLSTARVWFAAFQVPLALATMLLAMHAQLSFAATGKLRWLAAAVLATIASIASYEIFAPMIAGFVAALAFMHLRRGRSSRLVVVGAVAVIAAVALGTVAKLAVSGRGEGVGDLGRYWLGLKQLVRLDYDWRFDSNLNFAAATTVHFWVTLRSWAEAAWEMVAGGFGPELPLVAAAIATITYWRLRSPAEEGEPSLGAGRLLLIGLAALVLGHASFLIVTGIVFTPSGMANRMLVAAAVGVAIILVASLALLARAVPRKSRRAVFSLAVTVLAVGAVARIEQIATYWAEAPRMQQRVLEAARSDLQDLPAGSTVILDGVCPYHGPAIVFETSWDVGPALSLTLGKELHGDALSPRMSMGAEGLSTSMYAQPVFYAYAPNLYVYDPRTHRAVALPDQAAARRYFDSGRRALTCPRGYVGRGVPI